MAKLTLALKKYKWSVMPDIAALLCYINIRVHDARRTVDALTLRMWLNDTFDICGIDAPFLFAQDIEDVMDMMVFSGSAMSRCIAGVKVFSEPNCFLKLYKLSQGSMYKTFVPSRAARHLVIDEIYTKTNVRITVPDTCDTNDCMTILHLHGDSYSCVQAAVDVIRDQFNTMYSQVFSLRKHDDESVLPTPSVPRLEGHALYFRM